MTRSGTSTSIAPTSPRNARAQQRRSGGRPMSTVERLLWGRVNGRLGSRPADRPRAASDWSRPVRRDEPLWRSAPQTHHRANARGTAPLGALHDAFDPLRPLAFLESGRSALCIRLRCATASTTKTEGCSLVARYHTHQVSSRISISAVVNQKCMSISRYSVVAADRCCRASSRRPFLAVAACRGPSGNEPRADACCAPLRARATADRLLRPALLLAGSIAWTSPSVSSPRPPSRVVHAFAPMPPPAPHAPGPQQRIQGQGRPQLRNAVTHERGPEIRMAVVAWLASSSKGTASVSAPHPDIGGGQERCDGRQREENLSPTKRQTMLQDSSAAAKSPRRKWTEPRPHRAQPSL